MKNDLIDLVNVVTSQDSDGFETTTETLFKVFAEVKSAKRNEYYQAAAVGMNVQIVAVLNYVDYSQAIVNSKKPSLVIFENVKYRIVKTYRVGKSNDIELTLSEVE